MVKTLDRISDERLILGIRAGWFERDYDAYGFEFGIAGIGCAVCVNYCPFLRSGGE